MDEIAGMDVEALAIEVRRLTRRVEKLEERQRVTPSVVPRTSTFSPPVPPDPFDRDGRDL